MARSRQRYICIHGHFYQPPRENPWSEAVEAQESAAPFHDWNERITAECYAPNAAARVLDEQGRVMALHNNYERISFNFGPTLMAWLEQAHPSVHAQIVLADRTSERRFGCGSALAQVYGHNILPLADRRDQATQVRWGIADFQYRFGRFPDGMWLPETAVDRASLETLADNGIRFTVLAPTQALRVRRRSGAWVGVQDGKLDTTRSYKCRLGGGRDITLFFYDGAIAHEIAFGGLLHDGKKLAHRLRHRAGEVAAGGLVHIATDGESYGHHHRFGDMALAVALDALDSDDAVQLSNYASYLHHVEVVDEVEIRDNTAWSCAHGLQRWRSDCGCHTGGQPQWSQAWRTPLRETLDWLKRHLDRIFEEQGAALLRDPWAARDAYIDVMLHRHEPYADAATRERFLAQQQAQPAARDAALVWNLLEMQRMALLCFTSCAWFFDDCAGIETAQILTYAARALQLAAEMGEHLEADFLERLAAMRSNLPGHPNGKTLYRQLIRPRLRRL